ncbi:MAG: ABC transporter ATP-binding protein [Candidatus Binatia bacterium]
MIDSGAASLARAATSAISDTSAGLSPAEPVVRVRGLVKRFGDRTAVAGVDLDVHRGEIFGLLGPNGAGKTTTMRAIYGVTIPSDGRVEVFGLDVAAHGRRVRARLGVTLQDNVLIEALSPVENLRVFCRYHLLGRAASEKRIEELIAFLSLASHRDVPVRNLSGGYQRRVAIALSLVAEPELLILDEPTTGLDPAVRRALWDNVRALRDGGATVLLTTHYMDEAERLCDRVAVMSAGKVLAVGSPRELVARHLAVDVVEIEGQAAEIAQTTALVSTFSSRVVAVRSGRRTTFHCADGAGLADLLRRQDGRHRHDLVVRPSNLEDLFLHLTGSDLEGGA